MFWILLGLLSRALYGITNIVEKHLIDKKIHDPISITIFGGLLYFLLSLPILLVYRLRPMTSGQIALMLLAGIFLILYLIPYFKALIADEASRVSPLFQFVPIFVLLFSVVFLKENLSVKQLSGFLVILISGFILSLDKTDKGIFTLRKSFWYMLFSSLLYALTAIFFKFVVIQVDFWTTFIYQAFGAGIGAGIMLLYPPYRKEFIQETRTISLPTWGLLTVNQGITIFGELLGSYTFLLAPVALASVIDGFQPLFVLFYAVILSIKFPNIFKEDISQSTMKLKLFSVITIFLGLYLIYV